jgi:hypothetical protein
VIVEWHWISSSLSYDSTVAQSTVRMYSRGGMDQLVAREERKLSVGHFLHLKRQGLSNPSLSSYHCTCSARTSGQQSRPELLSGVVFGHVGFMHFAVCFATLTFGARRVEKDPISLPRTTDTTTAGDHETGKAASFVTAGESGDATIGRDRRL